MSKAQPLKRLRARGEQDCRAQREFINVIYTIKFILPIKRPHNILQKLKEKFFCELEYSYIENYKSTKDK